MGASYSHSFQPSLQPPSVIHRLHQGKVDHHLLVLVRKVYFCSFKILDQSVFCYRALSSLASVAKALSQRLRVKPINQSILSGEKKKRRKNFHQSSFAGVTVASTTQGQQQKVRSCHWKTTRAGPLGRSSLARKR